MLCYNNVNNAHCWAVNDESFEKIEHKTVGLLIGILLYTRKHIFILDFDIFIYIYSVRGEIYQISTITCKYSTCCAANVYIFVYTLNEDPLVPLSSGRLSHSKECTSNGFITPATQCHFRSTSYPLQLGKQGQYELKSLPETSNNVPQFCKQTQKHEQ